MIAAFPPRAAIISVIGLSEIVRDGEKKKFLAVLSPGIAHLPQV
jgi:hypothetical protein